MPSARRPRVSASRSTVLPVISPSARNMPSDSIITTIMTMHMVITGTRWNCGIPERDHDRAPSCGIDGFAFMKSTKAGWENYLKDSYTTIPPTADRMCATSMVASWKWSSEPSNYLATNAKILDTLLEVFSMTYSKSVQDSLYRMGEAALAAGPEISEISMACPNMHFILMNLSAFGLDNNNDVFLPTDEPHGQIECTVGRG